MQIGLQNLPNILVPKLPRYFVKFTINFYGDIHYTTPYTTLYTILHHTLHYTLYYTIHYTIHYTTQYTKLYTILHNTLHFTPSTKQASSERGRNFRSTQRKSSINPAEVKIAICQEFMRGNRREGVEAGGGGGEIWIKDGRPKELKVDVEIYKLI